MSDIGETVNKICDKISNIADIILPILITGGAIIGASYIGYCAFFFGVILGGITAAGIAPPYSRFISYGSWLGGLILPPVIPIGGCLLNAFMLKWLEKNNCNRPLTQGAATIGTLGFLGCSGIGLLVMGIYAGRQSMSRPPSRE